MATPVFSPGALRAFDEMNAQGCEDDYVVYSLAEAGAVLEVAARGRGGLSEAVRVLRERFERDVAVAIFRVTAVDARGSATSLRTKLVHVTYVGPSTPVMRRSKVGTHSSAFRAPFAVNHFIQTNDVSEITPEAVEKALRASGGAHQPSFFDFTNAAATGASSSRIAPSRKEVEDEEEVEKLSEATEEDIDTTALEKEIEAVVEAAVMSVTSITDREGESLFTAATPARVVSPASRSTVWERHGEAFDARDASLVAAVRAPDAVLVVTDLSRHSTRTFRGREEIKSYYDELFAAIDVSRHVNVVRQDTVPIPAQGTTISFTWEAPQSGVAGAEETLVVMGDAIVFQSIAFVPLGASQPSSSFPSAAAATGNHLHPPSRLLGVLPGGSRAGVATVKHLLLRGGSNDPSAFRVVALVRNASLARRKLRAALSELHGLLERVEFREGCDLASPSALYEAMRGVEGVLLVPPPAIENVREVMKGAAYAAELAGVRHVALLSACEGEYRRREEMAAVEQYITEDLRGVRHTFLRPTVWMENLLAWADRVAVDDEFYTAISPEARVARVSVEDVGKFAAAVLAESTIYGGKAYHISSSESLSCAEICEKLNRLRGGREVVVRTVPVEEWGKALGAKVVSSAIMVEDWLDRTRAINAGEGDFALASTRENSVMSDVVGGDLITMDAFLEANRDAFAPFVLEDIQNDLKRVSTPRGELAYREMTSEPSSSSDDDGEDSAEEEITLFLHGNLRDSREWLEAVKSLPRLPGKRHRAILPDLRSFGGSQLGPLEAREGMRVFSEDVFAMLAAMGIRSVSRVVATAMGAGVAMQLAIDHGEEIMKGSRLALVSPMSPFGLGGTSGEEGSPNFPDFAGSGAMLSAGEFVKRLRAGDFGDDAVELSPTRVIRTLMCARPLDRRIEVRTLASMFQAASGEDDRNFPGDAVQTANWPGFAPGEWGAFNAMSPKYVGSSLLEFVGLDSQYAPEVLWIRGSEDRIVSDSSIYDPVVAAKVAALPPPPPDSLPLEPQPMLAQTRRVLRDYGEKTGRHVEEVVMVGLGHMPHLEDPLEFRRRAWPFLFGVDQDDVE